MSLPSKPRDCFVLEYAISNDFLFGDEFTVLCLSRTTPSATDNYIDSIIAAKQVLINICREQYCQILYFALYNAIYDVKYCPQV